MHIIRASGIHPTVVKPIDDIDICHINGILTGQSFVLP